MLRFTLLAAAVALTACETPEREQATAPAAAPPSAADTSATSPSTVNPVQPGQSLPNTPPTVTEDPARQGDKDMPPGPVNPPTSDGSL